MSDACHGFRARRAAWLTVPACAFAFACGGSASAPRAGGTAVASGGDEPRATTGGADAGATNVRHGGLRVHVDHVRIHGALPDEPAPHFDHLDVSFDMTLEHQGTEPLTGVRVERVRLVEDEGRSITIGVTGDGWNGELQPGEQRVVAFTKTPDSSNPMPGHAYCGAWMRLEITLDLAGRRATAQSRRAQIACP